MRTSHRFDSALLALVLATVSFAAQPLAGPKGGRILTNGAPHAEFFVAQDRTVVVSFYDQNLKPVPVAGRVVSATAEAKSGKATLEFAEQNGALVSKTALPAGGDYTVVVQVRDSAGARPRNYRVVFDPTICDECKRAEYACSCDDAGHEKHPHKK